MVARKETVGRKKSSRNAIAKAVGMPPIDDETGAEQSKMRRSDETIPNIPEGEREHATKLQKEIRADKKYYSDVFKRMREDQEYARLGADKKWVDGDNYTVPIINRFINQAVSALYAKNPKAVAKRRKKLMFKLWDGTMETAKAAMQTVSNGMDQDGSCQAILDEIKQAKQYDQMVDKAGKTLELLFEYFTGQDYPDFKKQMKANVRRAKTVGVGYTELCYHRAMEADPDITERIGDMTSKIERIKTLQADKADGKLDDDPASLEDLEQQIKTLEEEKMKVVVEGLMFDFPRSTDIIPHRKCKQLAGFIGCDWVTREYAMEVDEIKDIFKLDVSTSYTVYVEGKGAASDAGGAEKEGDRGTDNSDDEGITSSKKNNKEYKGKACVWRMMHKKTRQIIWLCDGYPGYLRAPEAPEVQVRGFWTIFALQFNEVEDEKEVYPPSDVHFLKWPQKEFNNARQGMREHRKANRPKYFVKKGALEEEEKLALESAPAHAVIELKGLEVGITIDQLIQPYKGVPIDPALYETGSIVKDILYGVGAQSADMGQTSDATATESSIAEQSRMSTLASNVDDLDEHLSELAGAASEVLLQQMAQETVLEIVGPGAVWPQLDAQTISKELFLEIKAGSMGRPNQAAELANLERGMNFLIQLGGVNPNVIAKKYASLLNFDDEDFIVEGMPSIIALNAMAAQQAQTQGQIAVNAHPGNPANNPPPGGAPGAPAPGPGSAAPAGAPHPSAAPGMQGPAGMHNMPLPPGVSPQGQPAYTTPTHRYNAQGARVH